MIILLFSQILTAVACNFWVLFATRLGLASLSFIQFLKHDIECFYFRKLLTQDSFSSPLVALTLLTLILIILSSYSVFSNKNTYRVYFNCAVLTLGLSLICSFSGVNILFFYLFFEASLLPTYVIILGFGKQPERTQAGVYMILYTVLASLPLLVTIILYINSSGHSRIININPIPNWPYIQNFLRVLTIIAFIVKLPLYFVHLCLPKAHVEAPVAGSIILASIILKLGGYGVARFLKIIFPSILTFNHLIITWALVGGVIIRVVCLLQTDLKILIALSSVAHIALVIAGILSITYWGLNGALFIIIGHGFCSSALFCIANIVYERSGSRNLIILKGLYFILPALRTWWFLLISSNIAAPPSLNLLGESLSIISICTFSLIFSPLLASLVFIAASYSLYIYRTSQHGGPSSMILNAASPSLREFLILISHWVPLNLVILYPLVFQCYI